MTRKPADLVVPALLVLLCIAAFLGVFIHPGLVDRGRTSLMTASDYHAYFVPRFILGSEEVFHGRIPDWNPYEYGGIPLLATGQPAALYPPKAILFGLFSPVTALWVYLAVHYVALAVGCFAFLSHFGFRGVPLFVGVALWVFPTPLLLSSYNPVRIANLVWMPLLFLFAERLAERPTLRDFASLALVVALQLVAGYPESTIDTAFLIFVHGVASKAVSSWKGPFVRTLLIIGGAFFLGVVTAGAQLVPLAELGVVSHRAQMEVHPQMMRPDFSGIAFTVAPSLLVFGLVGLGVKRARPAVAGLVVCWFMSLGGWLLLRRMPGFHLTRFPFVWVFLGSFFFAWVAAYGVEALLAEAKAGKTAQKVGLVLALAAGVVFTFYMARAFPQVLHSSTEKEHVVAHYLGTKRAALLSIAAGLALTIATTLALSGRVRPAAFLAAAFLGVLAHTSAYPFGGVPAPFSRPWRRGVVASLHGRPREIRGRTLSTEDLLYGYEVTDHLPSVLGVEFSFLPWRSRRLLDRFDFLPMYGTINFRRLTAAHGYLNALDTQFIAADVVFQDVFTRAGFLAGRRGGRNVLFENPGRMGHAWVNYAVHRESSQEDALDYVIGRRFDPRREVVLEGDTRHVFPEKTEEDVTFPVAERRRSPIDVEFDVELSRSGVFVHSEAGYPGWQVDVDGKPSPWLQADYVLRGVELDAGRHTVRFRYRPWSVRIGVGLSLAGLFAIAALYGINSRRRRRLPPSIS